jgi:hypothetical protein
MNLNLFFRVNAVLFIIMGFLYRFGDYIYGLYMLDFEMSMFNINYKKNRLDNNIIHIYRSVD